MRILQLGKFYPIRGGVEKVMWNLTRGISERGVCCDMLCAVLPGMAPDSLDLPWWTGNGFRFNDSGQVHCVKALTKIAATMISPSMVRWLRKHGNEYDLIHIHHPDPMAALALRLSGFKGKVILHWHSDIVSQKTLLRFYEPLQRWLIKRACQIVGTTPAYLKESPYLKDVQDKCMAVPIGIQPIQGGSEDALRSRYPGKTLLLSIGRLVPYKGFHVAIEALKHLPADYHLILVGKGPQQEELENLAEREGLRDRITFSGYVPDEELADFYRGCDIFVLPSIMKTEAFGIVQIEAMSCGMPVVATTIPGSGVAWVNEDGVSGRNVPPEDPRMLAEAIEEVHLHRQRYSQAAGERFNTLFTENKMIDSILKLYEAFI